MLRRAWRPIAASAVCIGGPAYIYHRYSTRTSKLQTFDLPVKERGPDGQIVMVTRPTPLLSLAEVERRIREHASTESPFTAEGLTWKYTTARLSSNDPIEDANAQAVIQQESTAVTPAGSLMLFAVMDGHAGFHTSRLLAKVLIPAVSLELAALIHETKPTTSKSLLDNLKSVLYSKPDASVLLHADPSQISLAIQRAFTTLDAEIVNAPLLLLGENLAKSTKDASGKIPIPDLSGNPMAMASMAPALSGSCAILGVIDTAQKDLYVACTGDSRAVAGIWEETEDGQGRWRVEVLSEDQTGRNPSELKRMQSEHPSDEADDVIKRGRVLGGLEPTRAFGDARYKWPREAQAALNEAFLAGSGHPMRAAPPLLKTPPYVTAAPVITHRMLTLPTAAHGQKPRTSFRFLVLATDGLWDQLSSDDVVRLVGGHLAGLKGTVPRSELPRLVPAVNGAPTVDGKEARAQCDGGAWAFVDANLSAHLIRNAFGGGDEHTLRKLLSIPAPHARRWRDDVTVTVVWWEEAAPVKAKL